MAAGEMAAGEMAAGEMAAGEMAAGEMATTRVRHLPFPCNNLHIAKNMKYRNFWGR